MLLLLNAFMLTKLYFTNSCAKRPERIEWKSRHDKILLTALLFEHLI